MKIKFFIAFLFCKIKNNLLCKIFIEYKNIILTNNVIKYYRKLSAIIIDKTLVYR